MGATHGESNPAILIVGGVHGPHLVGSEIALRLAEQIAEKAGQNPEAKKRLEQYTYYIIPRANPDASEAFFVSPYVERSGNDTRTNDPCVIFYKFFFVIQPMIISPRLACWASSVTGRGSELDPFYTRISGLCMEGSL